LSGRTSRWLRHLLRSGTERPSRRTERPSRRTERPRREAEEQDNRGLLEVRDHPGAEAKASLHATLFETATAFTDLRRLQILRYPETHAEATESDPVTKLSMSPDAVSRPMLSVATHRSFGVAGF